MEPAKHFSTYQMFNSMYKFKKNQYSISVNFISS
ncbi:unnamed protein product [Paramecium pentaurelia]|uniref:Uncharacterized protein n=1 Tax=Paramecium pentaurelia TaxID=43138 RepID=A0A8S1WIV8_9CILI|nr:unnamed protein product [Paramecium pentaurelia]